MFGERINRILGHVDRVTAHVPQFAPSAPIARNDFASVDRAWIIEQMSGDVLKASAHRRYPPGFAKAIHDAAAAVVEKTEWFDPNRSMPDPSGFNDWYGLCCDCLTRLADQLPADVGASGMVCTIDAIGEAKDPARLVLQIAKEIKDDEKEGRSAAVAWWRHIEANAERFFRKGFLDQLGRMLMDNDVLEAELGTMGAGEIIRLLAATPFPAALRTQVPVTIPQVQGRSGEHYVGAMGSGKSCILKDRLRVDIERGFGVLLFDTQGDLSSDVIKHLDIDADRIVLMNPTDERYRPHINLCSMGSKSTPEQFATLFKRIMESMGATISQPQDGLLRQLCHVVRAMHRPTILDLSEVLGGDVENGKIGRYLYDMPPAAQKWVNEHWDTSAYEPTRQTISRRLYDLQSSEALGRMFAHAETNIDLEAELDAGKLVIVRLDKIKLGDDTPVVATVFLAMAMVAMWGRDTAYDSDIRDWRIYLDEFPDYFNDAGCSVLESFLSQMRKYRVGIVAAHQMLGQLPDILAKGLRNAQIRVSSRLEDEAEATAVAGRLKCSKDLLRGLKKHVGSHGEFVVWIEDRVTRGVKLTVPFDLRRKRGAGRSADEMKAIYQEMSERWLDRAPAKIDTIISETVIPMTQKRTFGVRR